MAKCPQCGVEVIEGSAFCHKCGATMTGEQNPALAEPASQAAPPEPTAAEQLRMAATTLQGGDKEVDLWEGDFSPKAMMETWILLVLATVGIIVAGVLIPFNAMVWWIAAGVVAALWLGTLLVLWFKQLSVHYKLTNQRFIHQRGILSRVTDRIEVIDMDDITFSQGVIERMLGVGTIKITSSDKTHPEIILPGVDNVREVSTVMDEARRQERRRRGLHIEAV